jgi:Flp pilus assembly protein TadB
MTTTFVIAIGEPYRVGGPGRVGDVWGSVLLRNSGVGFASLVVELFCVRLACLNGMVAPLGNPTIVRKAHRGLDERRLEELMFARLHELPLRLRRAGDTMGRAADLAVTDVREEVRLSLAAARLPQRLLAPVLDAYEREPHPSVFGISQAMTLAAQALAPEQRHDVEAAAGRYLAQRTEARNDAEG